MLASRAPAPSTLEGIFLAASGDFNANPANCFSASTLAESRVIIYGAGSGFRTLQATVLRPFRISPQLIIDKKFNEGTASFEGIPACGLTDTDRLRNSAADTVAVITMAAQGSIDEARAFLLDAGIQKTVSAFEIFDFHLIQGDQARFPSHPSFFLEHHTAIERAYSLLADESSRDVFRAVLATYIHHYLYLIPSLPLQEQYLPHDVPLRNTFSRLVDCGAFDGADVVRLRDYRGKPLESVVCFEPDLGNFSRLTAHLRAHDISDSLICIRSAVTNTDGMVAFAAGLDVNSRVDREGTLYVPTARLDSVLTSCRPTFIKMDIEGSELDALHGAEQTLRSSAPDLAICVYHRPSHLWETITFLDALQCGYRFYMRNHTSWIAETVLYATTHAID
jgi:FkbM family methyltransferase